MTEKIDNKEGRKNIPLNVYVEHFFIKYKTLSSCDLTILISHLLKSNVPFKKLHSSISGILCKFKKEGKILKVKPRQWSWCEK